jgi:uncharacterized protein YbjT (DUF2867 family)
MDKKIIAVVGATGAQGGGLTRAILAYKTGEFAVRAVTRKPTSEKARALADQGAQVVEADIDDTASLTRAFDGAYGAFCVTNFLEHFSAERETAQGKSLARAAKNAGVKHAIWSTFEDTRRTFALDDPRMPTLQGKYKVPHFDAKGEVDQTFRELGVPTTFLLTSFYWENLIYFGSGPKRGADGKLAFVLPMGSKKLPGISSEDIGKCALGIFKRPELIGKTVGIAGEHLSGAEMAAALSSSLEQPIALAEVTPEIYRGFGFPGASEFGNMFQFKAENETDYRRARDVVFSRMLNPELQTFGSWLSRNSSRIPLE